MANMSQLSPDGRGALTGAAATGLVVPAAGISEPVVSPKADHQPWRLPWTTFWLKPSSKSATTSPLAGAPQAREPLPPLPVLPPAPVEPPVPVVPPVPLPLPPVPVLPPLAPPVPVVPPVPLPLPPVPVVLIVVQVPLLQVWAPLQAWPQLPQLLLFEVVSMQLPPHSCWPETLQPQVPLTHDEPAPQAFPHVPQSAVFVGPLHVPSEHFVPDEQVDEQVPVLSQTSPFEHAVQLFPQCCGFD
jgi:hypothetical protein